MTDSRSAIVDPADFHPRLRRAADAMIAAIEQGPLDAAVPACPEWSVRDLVEHLGQVHQWARLNITDLESAPRHTTSPPGEGEDLAEWYRACFDDLAAVLTSTDPSAPAWTMQPSNRTAGFWSRRQCHELTMHVVDVHQATGTPPSYAADLAVDGIREIFDVWVHRRAAWKVPPVDLAAPVSIALTDRPERWLLVPTGSSEPPEYHAQEDGDPSSAVAGLRGTAEQLLFVLWRRAELSAVEIEGDESAVRRLLDSRITP